MKKLLALLLLFSISSFCFAGNAKIKESYTGMSTYSGGGYLTLVADTQLAPTSSNLVWYAYNIKGYSSIGITGFEVTAGDTPTTISAQAIYSDKTNVNVGAQVITAGTDLTVLHSPWYKFTLDAGAVTRDINFIFNIN